MGKIEGHLIATFITIEKIGFVVDTDNNIDYFKTKPFNLSQTSTSWVKGEDWNSEHCGSVSNMSR
jgi:hypothetical protein